MGLKVVTKEGEELIVMSAYDLVEENGKTWRENNLAKKHNFPLGTIVQVEVTKDGGFAGAKVQLKGTCELFVVKHMRDCDGTPLYCLADMPVICKDWIAYSPEWMRYHAMCFYVSAYSEDSLKPTGKQLPLLDSFHDFFFKDG